MPNYDGTYEVRIIYKTRVASVDKIHRHTFDVVLAADVGPGTLFDDVVLENWDTTNQALVTMVNAYADLMAQAYENTADILRAELWKYLPEPSTDASFISQQTLNVPGAAGAATVSAQQSTLTFRTVVPGIMRLQFMETITTLQTQLEYPTASTVYDDIFDFVSGNANAFAARNNSYPFSPLKASFGQNEKLWRSRNRS